MKKTVLSFTAGGAVLVLGILTIPLIADNNATLGDAAESRINPEAFVYILNVDMVCIEHWPQHFTVKYHDLSDGFAVGDGRHVVTAAHCLQQFENTPIALFQPMVASPHYGDLFEARIVAIDPTNDVAVLEVAWDGHPALELGTADELERGQAIKIAGYPPRTEERGGNGLFSRNIMIEETRLRGTNGRGACEVRLGPVNYPGKGWSGSPFINPETGNVVGLLTQKRYQKKWLFLNDDLIFGSHVDSIKRLLSSAHVQEGATGSFVPSPDAARRFDQILDVFDRFIDAERDGKPQLRLLCETFPSTSLLYFMAGWMCEGSEGEAYLNAAVESAPNSALLRANYGWKLMVREKYEEAAEQFQAVIERDQEHVFASYGLLLSLAQSDFQKAEELGKRVTERWPENKLFWYEYAKILRSRKKHSDQLEAIRKAVELCAADVPHNYQRQLADALAVNGQLEESDQAFQELLKTHECENCWRSYAALLSQMGPDKAAPAEEALARADAFKAEQAAESQ
jgi:tetratricopeptide (TPR) repeat protein